MRRSIPYPASILSRVYILKRCLALEIQDEVVFSQVDNIRSPELGFEDVTDFLSLLEVGFRDVREDQHAKGCRLECCGECLGSNVGKFANEDVGGFCEVWLQIR